MLTMGLYHFVDEDFFHCMVEGAAVQQGQEACQTLRSQPGVTLYLLKLLIVNFLHQSHPGRQATLTDRVGSAVPFPALFPVAASIPLGPPLLPCV